MIKEAIAQLIEREDLTQEEAREVMGVIMRGEATPGRIGGFPVAPRLKGETPEEIARRILGGEGGPKRDVVLLNAAGLLVAGGRVPDFPTGLSLGAQSLDSGRAREKPQELVAFTQGEG